jgi:hypothetical protein
MGKAHRPFGGNIENLRSRKDQELAIHLDIESIARTLDDQLAVPLRVVVSSEPVALGRLTQGEQAHLDGLAISPRRFSWLKGRSALKSLLGDMGEDEETAGISFPNRRFSLTHSGDFAIAVGTPSAGLLGIGVDLEMNRPILEDSARFFLTKPEQAWAMTFDGSTRTRNLLRLWTIKEALFKSDPRNTERWLADYSIEAPAANVGRAFVQGGEAEEFRYVSFDVEAGFLSVAVLPRRHNHA